MSCNHSQALAFARDGKWNAAHDLVQDYSDRKSCLIHAYLHRVEGDFSNARYWYRRANESMPNNSLEEELKRLHHVVDST